MSTMHDISGNCCPVAAPGRPQGRRWVKPLLFLLFVAGFIVTCPEPRKDFTFDLTPDIVDQGAGWLFSLWLKVLAWWQPGHVTSGADYLVFLGGVLFVFSALMLLPDVPLGALLGGQLTLFALWLALGESCLDHHGVEAWNVALGAMFIVQLGFWRGTRWDCFVTALFGAVLGYFPLMRQPAIQTPLACVFLLGVLGLAAGANAILRRAGSLPSRPVTAAENPVENPTPGGGRSAGYVPDGSILRFLKPLAVFFVCFLVVRSGASWVWSVMNNHATMNRHGAGHSLFSSLGFTRNAYNLTYSDDCWWTQGLLYEGRPWVDNDVHGQQALEKLWRARVLEDPALLLRGAFAKGIYLVRYFTGTLNPAATQHDGYPLRPSWITLALGMGFCCGAAYCVVTFWRLRTDRLLILAAGAVGLGIAAFAQLVIVVPFYLGCGIAYCLGMFFIFMPAVRQIARAAPGDGAENTRRRNTLVCLTVGLLALLLALGVAGYTSYRFFVNRAQARELLTGDPLEKLRALRLDFAFRFNRLSLVEQQQVIIRLLSAPSTPPVFRPQSTLVAGAEKLFTPVLAVMGDGFVCVAAKLARTRAIPFPSRAQGPKSSVLLVLPNADRLGTTLEFMESPDKYLKIADGNWDGRYRMFVLPAPPGYAAHTRFLGVSAFNFIDGAEGEAVVLDLIAGERLYPGDPAPRATGSR